MVGVCRRSTSIIPMNRLERKLKVLDVPRAWSTMCSCRRCSFTNYVVSGSAHRRDRVSADKSWLRMTWDIAAVMLYSGPYYQ